ncbi:MAG: Lcl C-terminal domain-containing protein [Planctomycetota bacterium]
MRHAIQKNLVEAVPPSLNMVRSHLKELYSLRSTAKKCSQKDINAMLIKHNFYDSNLNTQGVFINKFEPIVINDDKVITDYYTGLMWHQSGSIEQLEWIKGVDWISELNFQKYAGYVDWRMPTVEEAASLLRRREASMPQFVDPGFSCLLENIWTRDSYEVNPDWFKLDVVWYVDYTDGYVSKHYACCGHYIRPVRSCK